MLYRRRKSQNDRPRARSESGGGGHEGGPGERPRPGDDKDFPGAVFVGGAGSGGKHRTDVPGQDPEYRALAGSKKRWRQADIRNMHRTAPVAPLPDIMPDLRKTHCNGEVRLHRGIPDRPRRGVDAGWNVHRCHERTARVYPIDGGKFSAANVSGKPGPEYCIDDDVRPGGEIRLPPPGEFRNVDSRPTEAAHPEGRVEIRLCISVHRSAPRQQDYADIPPPVGDVAGDDEPVSPVVPLPADNDALFPGERAGRPFQDINERTSGVFHENKTRDAGRRHGRPVESSHEFRRRENLHRSCSVR